MKTNRTVIILVSVLIAFFIAGFIIFINCLPRDNDIDANQAIAIAKLYYHFDNILLVAVAPGGSELTRKKGSDEYVSLGHYAYCVIGEKDGQEILLIVPSNPEKYEPFVGNWVFDYSFKEIVEKFNEYGANYDAYVPGDYYSRSLDDYIKIDRFSEENDNELYARLDVKVVFKYHWKDGDYRHYCTVTQEGGELKAYERVDELSGNL